MLRNAHAFGIAAKINHSLALVALITYSLRLGGKIFGLIVRLSAAIVHKSLEKHQTTAAMK